MGRASLINDDPSKQPKLFWGSWRKEEEKWGPATPACVVYSVCTVYKYDIAEIMVNNRTSGDVGVNSRHGILSVVA